MAARFSTGFLLGAAIGAGAALAGGERWPAVRPLAKGALRVAVLGLGAARRASLRIGEEFEDLLAETLHEIDSEKGATASPESGHDG